MLGLRTTIYKVEDLPSATAWYTKVFETEPYFNESFYVGFNIGGFELGLMPDVNIKGNNVTAYWGVENIDESFERILNLGAKKVSSPENVGGELMVAVVLDPWDNEIGLIYNPYFKIS